MSLQEGDAAPDFTLPADGGKNISLSDYKGRKVILYFYPKDDTPGCTKEACAFRDSLERLNGINASVIGVSKDTVGKHEKFKTKHSLNFPLVSDEDGTLCEKYGTWVEKSMYGKKYMGIDRATFLIGEDGNILRIWRKVKVPGHVDEVVQAVEAGREAA